MGHPDRNTLPEKDVLRLLPGPEPPAQPPPFLLVCPLFFQPVAVTPSVYLWTVLRRTKKTK